MARSGRLVPLDCGHPRALAAASPGGGEARREAARVALAMVPVSAGRTWSAVEVRIDGARFAVNFSLDAEEHRRRQAGAVGAATDTGLLHVLWSLPGGIPIPAHRLDRRDLSTLGDLGRGFVEGTDTLTRTFRPAGSITAVAVVANRLQDAFGRVALLPPVFWRVAAGLKRPRRPAMVALCEASGIGAVVMADGEPDVLVPPRPPRMGVPAIYRWWLSELAYRNWSQANCAH